MDIFYIGILLLSGYFLSVLSMKLGFPKIVGYLVAGILLNTQVIPLLPESFVAYTGPVISFCLAFITFEIGSSFSLSELKSTGKKYFKLAVFESIGAFVFIFIVFFLLSLYILPFSASGVFVALSFSLIIASLGAPTDPSATLAVIHEYKARGFVTNSILGAAAFDDIITLVLFSFSFSIAHALLGTNEVSLWHILYTIGYKILGAALSGVVFGFIFNKLIVLFKVEDKKSLLILFLGFLSITFGSSIILGFDELFSTLILGFIVRNFNKEEKKILNLSENGLEDLFFLVFFVFSALNFNFDDISFNILLLIFTFIAIRILGKFIGMRLGSQTLRMPENVKKYAFVGLIPQGGIVLGLSLMIGQEPEFKVFSNLIIGVIMGATIIHEFIGPILSKMVLKKAKEISKLNKNK